MLELTMRVLEDAGSDRIESFVRSQVDDLLKRTRVEAEADAHQAAQEQTENGELNVTWKATQSHRLKGELSCCR